MLKLITTAASLAPLIASAMASDFHNTVSTQSEITTCKGSLANVSDAPDAFYNGVVWVGTHRFSCFFRLNMKEVSLAILKVCNLDQPCEVEATVREIKQGGECRTGCTSLEIIKVRSVKEMQ